MQRHFIGIILCAAIAVTPLSVMAEVGKKPPEAGSVASIYQQQNALFVPGQITVEPGITYAYSDSNSLTLNGFLALGAIFLGNINVSKITTNIETFNLQTTYSPTASLQVGVNVPYMLRQSTYETVGVQNSTAQGSEQTVKNGGQIGDLEFLANYQFLREGGGHPALIWNNKLTAPTGRSPYGIQLETQSGNANLTYPSKLATGIGVWSLTTGVTFIKTSSPAILFGNFDFTHNFERPVHNINSQPPAVRGDVAAGNIFGFGFGTAFAINDQMSLTFAYAETISAETYLRPAGSTWQSVVGSANNAAAFSIGASYALDQKTTLVTNVAVGLTKDAPNLQISLKIPYTF